MHTRAADIAGWLRERVTAAGARGIVVGLSGGVDSAVVARLAQMATPDRVLGVIMPADSDPADEADARIFAAQFSLPVVRIDLHDAYEALTSELARALPGIPSQQPLSSDEVDLRARLPAANVKPRLRMTALYYIANSMNYLVAGTGNRCELTIGYFTKHGDGGVDALPIGHLLKSEVQTLARDLGIPETIVQRTPSAGLWQGQTDEEDMGLRYADLERYLAEGPQAVAPALALRIERLVRQSQHKRATPPLPDDDPVAIEP